ncbi:GNAT family N-acetyltransferase [Streptomyces fulvoviolaceus]|uniref:GNAT family N-acetyltransferase n=1 Tax=Streptomyces fulvoviolaceus TaxID=285535 RepID=UPI00131E1DA7|nr:GNAT family N-acetyltransferase [Streptomyces fulvoviolaceus]
MRVDVHESVNSLDTQAWDTLAAHKSFYMGTGWLRFQEKMNPEQRCRFITVSDGGRLIAALPTFLTPRPANKHYNVAAMFPEAVSEDTYVLLVGGTRGYQSRILLDDDALSPEHRGIAVGLLVDQVQAMADQDADGVSWWLYFSDEDVELLRPWAQTIPRVLRGDCAIDLHGHSFEDYLAATGRRRQIMRDRRRFDRTGYTVRRRPLSELLSVAGDLLSKTQNRYGFDVSPQSMTNVLTVQNEATGNTGVVYECADGDETLGFCLAYEAGDTVYGRAVGFDYDRLRDGAEYFTLGYYAPIEHAYRSGMRRLHLGTSAYEAKILRGAAITPLWALALGARPWSSEGAIEHNAAKLAEISALLPDGPRYENRVTSTLWREFASLSRGEP